MTKYKKEILGLIFLLLGFGVIALSVFTNNLLFIPGFLSVAVGIGMIGAIEFFQN